MRTAAKKYNVNYKKKTDTYTDTFVPRGAPKGVVQCTGCGAFYYRRHWSFAAPPGITLPVRHHPVYCPACEKIRQRSASGELHLLRVADGDRAETIRILRNEEARAREKNPLERIMTLRAAGDDWKVETTTEKLAQRLGRAVAKARGGKLDYKWSHNNKFVRIEWRGRE